MIIIFDLIRSGIVSDISTIVNNDGVELSYDNVSAILAFIATKYTKSEYETIFIKKTNLYIISPDYEKYINFLVDKDVIKCNIIEDSYSIQFSNNFKKFSVISDILINKDDEVQGKIQNQTIPILKNTDLRLIKDLYDIEIVNIPIKKQLLIEPDIYDFKSYILSLFNFKRISNGDMFYNWRNGILYTPFKYCSKYVKLNNFKFDDKLVKLKIPNSFPLFFAIWCVVMGINKEDYDFKEWCSLVKKEHDNNDKSKFFKDFRKKLDKLKDSNSPNINFKDVNINSKIEAKHFSHIDAIREFNKWIIKQKPDSIVDYVFRLNYSSIYELVNKTKDNIYQEIINLQYDFMINKIASKLYEIDGIKILISDDEIYFQSKYLNDVKIIWDNSLNELYNLLPNSIIDDLDIDYDEYDIYYG